MFEEFFKRYKEKKALREWERSPLGQALARHVNEYFTEYPRFAEMDEADKQETIRDFYKLIAEVLQAENPGVKLRESLANYVISFAELQVLCLTEDEKTGAFYADCPYISGQLHHDIEKAIPHVEFLREAQWRNADLTGKSLVGLCNARSARWLFIINGLNLVRIEFKDFDDQKDWFRPFLQAMMIWEEDLLRGKMQFPRLLPDLIEGLQYSAFMNLVVNGWPNPYYEWEKRFAKKLGR